MRLWHYRLLKYLDRQHLLSQHRECCALRGKGWGKKHATVDYAFKYDPHVLYEYHEEVMHEMAERGYAVDNMWHDPLYRGKYESPLSLSLDDGAKHFAEHDDAYLLFCVKLLEKKGCDMSLARLELSL